MTRAIICASLVLAALASHPAYCDAPKQEHALPSAVIVASWYGPGFHGRRTANGERFNQNDPTTAAHPTLPFGTRLLVCLGLRCIIVRINDRGPYVAGRSLDLSKAAAEALKMQRRGTALVRVWILSRDSS